MQTKKQSFIEAVSNTAVGFLVSYASTFLIFPVLGIVTTPGTNLVIVIYFTVISILRGYVIRRLFNKKPTPPTDPYLRDARGRIIFAHCFECEYEMPVKHDENFEYCSNCGLKH